MSIPQAIGAFTIATTLYIALCSFIGACIATPDDDEVDQ
jgi:hypothetical protein